ncbi:MAG: hypothetical protein ACFFEN_12230 [Candidatus Thorarchaeota archaeon]
MIYEISLTFTGWLNGITALGVFFFSFLFGLFFALKSRKKESNLLLYLGLIYIFAALIYMGDVIDFFTIIATGSNIDNSTGFIGLMNWVWFPGAVLFAMYVGAILITPKGKWYVFSPYIVLGIVFEVFLFLDPSGTIEQPNPVPLGSDLINDNLNLISISGLVALIFLLSIFIFLGFGFLIKGIQSTGTIRRKFILISFGAFIYIIGAVMDGLLPPGIYLIFVRSMMVLSAWLFYFGLR